jgi:hypothetical protein
MPSKREIAREMLQKLEPWSEIKEAAGDGSGTYEELRTFLVSTGKRIYEEIREKQGLLDGLRVQVNEVQNTLNNLKSEQSRLEKENEQLTNIRSTLVSENKELKHANQDLNNLNEALKEKGVDDEVIKRMLEFDHQEKDELVERIGNFSDYVDLRGEIELLEGSVKVTRDQIDENKETLATQEDRINGLREETIRLETGFERAGKVADIANLAVEYGYSPAAFESLVKIIENFRDLTPYSTNNQVFEALQEYHSLEQIRAETLKAQKENQAVRSSLLETRGELDAIKNYAMASIREAGEDSELRISDASKRGETGLDKMFEHHKRLLKHGETKLFEILENLEARNKLVDEKFVQLSKYELLLKNSMVITTSYYNPEAAKNIPLKDISKLACIVDHWVQFSLKGASGYPSNEVRLSTGFGYGQFSLSGASRFLTEELSRRAYS